MEFRTFPLVINVMTPFQCDFLSKQGFESFVVSVGKDSHYLIGSQRGKSFLVERTFLVTDFILYCKGNSPRARKRFNQVVEAKRFEGVFLCRKVC